MQTVVERIIDPVRKKTGCTLSEISNDEMLVYLNDRYLPLHRKFALSNREAFQGRWKENIVAGNAYYNVPQPNADANINLGQSPYGVGSIQEVYVNYGDGYKKATEITYQDIEDNTYIALAENASQSQPRYKVFEQQQGKVIEFYPTPKDDVADGFMIIADQRPHKLSLSHDETRILIPEDYISLLKDALMIDVFFDRKEENRAMLQEQRYEKNLRTALNEWKRSVYRVIRSSKNPNLSRYE